MTPHNLELEIRKAQEAAQKEPDQLQNIIFHMLTVLLQHEADKAAGRPHG